MKACKGLFLFCFLGIAVSSCFDPPVYTDIPTISFNKISFKKKIEGVPSRDSLILYLDFKDGDGDLGLDPSMTAPPFNSIFYYLADGVVVDGKGRLNPVTSIPQLVPDNSSPNQPDMFVDLIIAQGATGKLATNKTRTKPNYGYLPAYNPAGDCNYTKAPLVMVVETDNLVDGTYNIVDTLVKPPSTVKYFVIEEPVYYQQNPNSDNIEIEFWFLDTDAVFKPYDVSILTENCNDFNGRFLYIPHRIGDPLEGTLKYAMDSDAFFAAFSNKTLKLKIRIRDRALNVSNELETPEFFLPSICTNCD